LCANVDSSHHQARFVYEIPDGFPGLSGLFITVYVNDGGTPGANGDVFSFAVASDCSNAGPIGSSYVITDGNLVVH
jgi:hypothetical protein